MVARAINDLLGGRDTFLPILQANILQVLENNSSGKIAEIDHRLVEQQQKLVKLANGKKDYNAVADEIHSLREQRQKVLAQDAEHDGQKKHIEELKAFLEEQKPSKYLIDTAIKNIEGDISIDEAQELLNTYYEENPKADTDDRTEEADKVAVRIAKILSEKAFSFTPNEYISIHKKLFAGIYGHAGKLRDYNITKKEWVLNGATVLYGSASELRATLDYDFAEEKKFSYKNLSMEEIIHHLAFFVSRLWQIHVFGEGNTRTTAVFFIKYLRTLGFDATNDIFAENAWYFRNALVRANYNDLKNGVHETTEYLELFLRNLLLDEKNELHNRTMHISGRFAEVDIERVKVDIKSREVDIESTKVDIRNKLLSFSDTISEKTINHTVEIFSKCGKENCFGRTIVEEITGLKPSRASKLIKLLVDSEVIVPVTGHGKGKYRFQ